MNIGEKIKQKRKDSKFTQEEIAERVHVSRQTISSWENSKSLPDVTSLILLSDIYHVSLDELIKGDMNMIENIKTTENLAKESYWLKKSKLITEFSLTGAMLLYLAESLKFINTHSLIPILLIFALLASSIPYSLKRGSDKSISDSSVKNSIIKKITLIATGIIIGFIGAYLISIFF